MFLMVLVLKPDPHLVQCLLEFQIFACRLPENITPFAFFHDPFPNFHFAFLGRQGFFPVFCKLKSRPLHAGHVDIEPCRDLVLLFIIFSMLAGAQGNLDHFEGHRQIYHCYRDEQQSIWCRYLGLLTNGVNGLSIALNGGL